MGLVNIRTLTRGEGLAITLDQAKAHCFIVPEDDTQDAYLTDTIKTAQSLIENDPLIPYVFFTSAFEAEYLTDARRVLLPKSPAVSLDKIEEYDGDKWGLVDNNEYFTEFGDSYDYAIFKTSHRGLFRRLRISFTAGHESADEIRPDIKRAVASLVAYMFDNRAAMGNQQLYKSDIYAKVTGGLKRPTF